MQETQNVRVRVGDSGTELSKKGVLPARAEGKSCRRGRRSAKREKVKAPRRFWKMALSDEMQESVTTDHLRSLLPVTWPALTAPVHLCPTFPVQLAPNDDNSRFFRSNSIDSRIYPTGEKCCPTVSKVDIANAERSPGAVPPPHPVALLSHSCRWRHRYPRGPGWLITPLNSQLPLTSPLVPSFCKD